MGDEWLEVTEGPADGGRLDVGLELAVGRAQRGQADLAGDPQLSRKHARFWRAAGGELIVEDLGSANGTFVNGERIDRPAVLSVGDAVQLGGTTLVVHGTQPAPPSPPPSAPPTRVRSGPRPGPKGGAPREDRLTGGVEASGGPATAGAAKPRLLLPLSLLLGLLLVAVVALSVALATRGGTASGAVVHNSAVVDPLFPVTGLSFSGQVATFKSTSTRGSVSATIDWGDGTAPTRGVIGPPSASDPGSYTRPVSGSHTYSRVATYAVTVTVAGTHADLDRASNLAVVTNCFCVTKLPTFARTLDLGPVSGQVFIRLPASGSFVPLTTPREIPVGSQLDATHGSLVVQAATATAGKLQAGVFDGGLFQINQAQTLGGLIDLRVQGASTAGCVAGQASRVLALLHASVSGSFQTQAKYSAATVRGTEWTTIEQCDGTLTRVQRGAVQVRNLRTGQTTVVPAGQSYLARSP